MIPVRGIYTCIPGTGYTPRVHMSSVALTAVGFPIRLLVAAFGKVCGDHRLHLAYAAASRTITIGSAFSRTGDLTVFIRCALFSCCLFYLLETYYTPYESNMSADLLL